MLRTIVEGEPGIFPDPVARVMRTIGGWFGRRDRAETTEPGSPGEPHAPGEPTDAAHPPGDEAQPDQPGTGETGRG